MRDHFTSVMAMHDAIVRGDIPSARAQARTIVERPGPSKLPESAAPYLEAMRSAAARAASEDTLEDLAGMAGAMFALCGDCHRAVGVRPSPTIGTQPNVGGPVGHMLEHKRAVDLMVEGLTVPSASAWTQGATLLSTAPMHRPDVQLAGRIASEVRDKERQIHSLAKRAASAADARSRLYVYGEVVQRCAACHALHPGVWGPPKPR
jgi:mono/diheme cytochrome c family protein